MPKSIVVDPKTVRKKSQLKTPAIPLNAYQPDLEKEKKRYGEESLRQALLHMLIIREFETALNDIKTQGAYAGIEYNHRGPAHPLTPDRLPSGRIERQAGQHRFRRGELVVVQFGRPRGTLGVVDDQQTAAGGQCIKRGPQNRRPVHRHLAVQELRRDQVEDSGWKVAAQVELRELNPRADAAGVGVGAGPLQRGGRNIDTQHVPAPPGQPDRIRPLPTAQVQRPADGKSSGDLGRPGVDPAAPYPGFGAVMLLPGRPGVVIVHCRIAHCR